MKVKLDNGNNIVLNKHDFVAAGGEGSVYRQGNIAFKIYQDRKKMIPIGKIKELSLIRNNNVIVPKSIVYNYNDNKYIGYSMRFISDTYALCQIFTKAFRNRNNISHDITQNLVKNLYNIVLDVHKANVLIVDLNEMNFLVSSKDFKSIFAIDTDSYQTVSFPATALMESVRDRHCKTFSENTDWFSYGIVSFQMFVGIHPYKGKYKGKVTNIEDRMQNNISVLNKDVSVPGACYSFDEGKRLPPPESFENVIIITSAKPKVTIQDGGDNIDISLVNDYHNSVYNVIGDNVQNPTVVTRDYVYLSHARSVELKDNEIVFTSPQNIMLAARIENGVVKIRTLFDNKNIKYFEIAGEKIFSYNNNLYVKNGWNLNTLEIFETANDIIISSKTCAGIMQNSTQFFDNVFVQQFCAQQDNQAPLISLVETDQIRNFYISELINYRILSAKYERNVLMIIGIYKGIYCRFVFKFDNNIAKYICFEKKENIIPSGINFTVLDSGAVVFINEEDEIEIFSSSIHHASKKVVKDIGIMNLGVRLFSIGNTLLFSKENSLYKATMKKKGK